MTDLCNTYQLGEKFPILAAYLGAFSVPTEFNLVIAHKRGGVLLEWHDDGKPAMWHVPGCARIDDILSDSRRKNAPQQLIVDRLPAVVYSEMLRGRCDMRCRACLRSITLPPDYEEPDR